MPFIAAIFRSPILLHSVRETAPREMGAALPGISGLNSSTVLRKHHYDYFNPQLQKVANIWLRLLLVLTSWWLPVNTVQVPLVALDALVSVLSVHLTWTASLCSVVYHVH